jgi:hypothetical protein
LTFANADQSYLQTSENPRFEVCGTPHKAVTKAAAVEFGQVKSMRINHQIGRQRVRIHGQCCASRKASVAVEAAIVLPLLLLLFVGAVDYARVFRQMQIIAECARVGAVYAADPDLAARTGFETVEAISLDAAGNMSPPPVVVVAYGTDSRGDKYAEVTVSHSFRLMTNVFGSQPMTLSRKSRARFRPAAEE